MDKSIMDLNIGFYDRSSRFLFGLVALVALMATDTLPPTLALLTLYPTLTAIVAWDPLYAVQIKLGKAIKSAFSAKTGKLALQ